MPSNLLAQDREEFLGCAAGLMREIKGERIFITGGTGFFGCWLLETFLWANREYNLGSKVLVLTRDAVAFKKKWPHLAEAPEIAFQTGDIRFFEFPRECYAYIIHAAGETALGQHNSTAVTETAAEGTRRALEFSKVCGVKSFLLTSSGAVYGRPVGAMNQIFEDDASTCDASSLSAYGQAKKEAEGLCLDYAQRWDVPATIARCFAFLGPYLPLDRHYAVGNFIRGGLSGGPIKINGDGKSVRSYLYGADLALWLWTILLRGKRMRPYNVGSESAISIADLAHEVAEIIGSQIKVDIAGASDKGLAGNHYVPSSKRAREELGLVQHVERNEGLRRSVRWAQEIAGNFTRL